MVISLLFILTKPPIRALAQHICMSVFKARRVIDQIGKHSYEEILMILELMPYRAYYPILKLVYSTTANASHNMDLNEADSFISKAEVNNFNHSVVDSQSCV